MTLDKQRWRQVDTIYHAALERGPLARAALLEEACAGDEELRREVEELLGDDGARPRALSKATRWRLRRGGLFDFVDLAPVF